MTGGIVNFLGRPGEFLAKQIVIKYLARNRRGRDRPEPGIFHDYRERYFGLVGRSVGDEQRMITMPFLHAALDIFLVLLDGDDLRGAGFAGAIVFRAGKGARARAFRVDSDQSAFDYRDMFGLQIQGAHRFRSDKLALASGAVFHVIDDVRL